MRHLGCGESQTNCECVGEDCFANARARETSRAVYLLPYCMRRSYQDQLQEDSHHRERCRLCLVSYSDRLQVSPAGTSLGYLL